VSPADFPPQLEHLLEAAVRLFGTSTADAMLLLVDQRLDWDHVRSLVGSSQPFLVAADEKNHLAGCEDWGLRRVLLDVAGLPVHERLAQALLECVAAELIAPEAQVVAIYSGFEAGTIDSVSVLRLEEHLGQLTSRDLRNLETKVPLETLKQVVDLAVEIGREGREGKPVGTLFVVGDTRKVMASSHATGFDPVRGYSRAERNLSDPRVREGIKEIAQLDGAFVVGADGTVEGAARYIDASAENVSVAKGLGARHWAAAAITRPPPRMSGPASTKRHRALGAAGSASARLKYSSSSAPSRRRNSSGSVSSRAKAPGSSRCSGPRRPTPSRPSGSPRAGRG
jgi:DNA integrity scanning protein DisA with diadenylate cyclase activity